MFANLSPPTCGHDSKAPLCGPHGTPCGDRWWAYGPNCYISFCLPRYGTAPRRGAYRPRRAARYTEIRVAWYGVQDFPKSVVRDICSLQKRGARYQPAVHAAIHLTTNPDSQASSHPAGQLARQPSKIQPGSQPYSIGLSMILYRGPAVCHSPT